MVNGRKLIKTDEYPQIMAECHLIEGTSRHILELLCFGFAYSSYYLLLRSSRFLAQLDDEQVRANILAHPYKYGKRLDFGKELALDRDTDCIYYLKEIEDKYLL